MGRQWHQLDHVQIVCTSLQTDNYASTSSINVLQAGCSSWHPTNSVKALKVNQIHTDMASKYCALHRTELVAFSALTMLTWRQEGHLACKKWGGDDGGGHWLVRMEWHPAGWSVCLPLLIFPCTIKSRSSLSASAHLGGPGKRAVKWLWRWCTE